MINLVLFGPPGAGKGTQSDKLVRKYKFVHLSTGDIFRRNIKEETELGKLAKSYMDKGQLVPDSVTIKMLESEVDKNKKAIGFIFDGFPRNAVQAKALDKFLTSKKTSISKMIALEVTEEELKKRLLERGKTSGRPDDVDPNVIQKRIDVYNSETAPVKKYYQKQNKFDGIMGIGTIDSIFKGICNVIDGLKSPAKKKTATKTKKSVSKTPKATPTKKKAVKKVVAKKKTSTKVSKSKVKKVSPKKKVTIKKNITKKKAAPTKKKVATPKGKTKSVSSSKKKTIKKKAKK